MLKIIRRAQIAFINFRHVMVNLHNLWPLPRLAAEIEECSQVQESSDRSATIVAFPSGSTVIM
jgi:hypothetical protein